MNAKLRNWLIIFAIAIGIDVLFFQHGKPTQAEIQAQEQRKQADATADKIVEAFFASDYGSGEFKACERLPELSTKQHGCETDYGKLVAAAKQIERLQAAPQTTDVQEAIIDARTELATQLGIFKAQYEQPRKTVR
jgi:hypothetical protein